MNRSVLSSIILLIISSLQFACQPRESDQERVEEAFKGLKNNQARVIVQINGKEFYSAESIFTGQALISDNMLSMTFTDQFEGKTMVNLGGEKWFTKKPVNGIINQETQIYTNVKMGKLVDREKMIGEGYMMAEGEITALEFSKEKMVFKIKGMVGKYSDFQQPDKYLPAEGIIVYKMPAASFGNITENEVFDPATSH